MMEKKETPGFLTRNIETVDYTDLEGRIEKSLRDKMLNGNYTSAEADAVGRLAMDLAGVEEMASIPPLKHVTALVDEIDKNVDATRPYEFKTHRTGLAGKLIVTAKKLLALIFRPATVILERQTQFNGKVNELMRIFGHGLYPQLSALAQMQGNSTIAVVANEVRELNRMYRELARYVGAPIDSGEIGRPFGGRGAETEARLTEFASRLHNLNLEMNFLTRKMESALKSIESRPAGSGSITTGQPAHTAAPTAESMRDFDYFMFEERHRGSQDFIKKRLESYADLFAGKKNVLDVGCGRGELMDVFRARGIGAEGIDINEEMIRQCKEKGLSAEVAGLEEKLVRLKQGSIDGVISTQVVEHLSASQLGDFIRLAFDKLAPGGMFVAETINPRCLSVFSNLFYLDPTHVRPVEPAAMEFALERAGFRNVRTVFTSPVSDEAKLHLLPQDLSTEMAERDLVREFNYNAEKLNSLLYNSQEYYVIAVK